ncbi:MAG: FtsQ-type POTRA domain-containing protein [Actinomycetota bacterium]|nr:FtsQ-type POTRA domain-containing protein [Actinomycetota bacterium]
MNVGLPVLGAVGERSGEDEPGAANRTRILMMVAGLVVLIAAVLTWIVAFSPLLGADTVTVHGTRDLTATQIRQAAAIKHASPLVRLDTEAVTRRVEALPLVASATVRTDYPSTVVITVTERVAVGYLSLGTRYLLVDRTGAQFRTLLAKPRSLPMFVVPAGPNAKATGHAVATVAAALPRALLARVDSVQAFDPTAITLLLTDHRVVRWGSADRDADKARILPLLLGQPGTTFDVTNPDQVVTH